MATYTLFGPLDAVLGGVIEYVLLALVVANITTRLLAHRQHIHQADDGGAEAITRHPAHVATNVLLVLASFYYLTLHHHSGVVTSVLVVGMFVTDVFEFEARKVEARRDIGLELPKGSIAASVLVFLYVGYLSLFFVVAPVWNSLV